MKEEGEEENGGKGDERTSGRRCVGHSASNSMEIIFVTYCFFENGASFPISHFLKILVCVPRFG